MQVTKPLAFAFLLLTGACASTPGERGSQATAKKPLRGGIAEFRLTSYDGRDLKGRVLLGATVDPLVIDVPLLEGAGVELRKVRACGKTELLEYIMADLWRWTGPEDIITIRPGYWFGVNVSFVSLFDEKQTGPGPDCFEAEVVVQARGGAIAARLPIRAERTDKPPAPSDARAPAEPKPPAPDAGAP